MSAACIGAFTSGVGGLAVLRALREASPFAVQSLCAETAPLESGSATEQGKSTSRQHVVSKARMNRQSDCPPLIALHGTGLLHTIYSPSMIHAAFARVTELVDVADLKFAAEKRTGSSPVPGTNGAFLRHRVAKKRTGLIDMPNLDAPWPAPATRTQRRPCGPVRESRGACEAAGTTRLPVDETVDTGQALHVTIHGHTPQRLIGPPTFSSSSTGTICRALQPAKDDRISHAARR